MGNIVSECMGEEPPAAQAMKDLFVATSQKATTVVGACIPETNSVVQVDDYDDETDTLDDGSLFPSHPQQQHGQEALERRILSQEDGEDDDDKARPEITSFTSPSFNEQDVSFAQLLQIAKAATATAAEDPQTNTGKMQERDLRAFLLLIHPTFGLLALHCTRKKSKPPHYQLPGGHVDAEDFPIGSSLTPAQAYQQAAKAGGLRELWEETGMDWTMTTNRIHPLIIHSNPGSAATPAASNKKKKQADSLLPNEFKDRLFFIGELQDADFLQQGDPNRRLVKVERHASSDPSESPLPDFWLNLSNEHSGFCFLESPTSAIENLELHSGGKVSTAIRMALAVVNQMEVVDELLKVLVDPKENEKKDKATGVTSKTESAIPSVSTLDDDDQRHKHQILTIDESFTQRDDDPDAHMMVNSEPAETIKVSQEDIDLALQDLDDEFQVPSQMKPQDPTALKEDEDLAVSEILEEFNDSADEGDAKEADQGTDLNQKKDGDVSHTVQETPGSDGPTPGVASNGEMALETEEKSNSTGDDADYAKNMADAVVNSESVPEPPTAAQTCLQSPEKASLEKSYAEIAKERREREDREKEEKEEALAKLQADKEAERLKSIRRMEEQRKRSLQEKQKNAGIETPTLKPSPAKKAGPQKRDHEATASDKKFILLISKMFSNPTQNANQERIITMLSGKNLPFDTVDGSNADNKDRRNELFEISGVRGNYPQVFLEDTDGKVSFVGGFEIIEDLNESGDLVSLVGTSCSTVEKKVKEETAHFEKMFLLLISTMSGNAAQKGNQERTLAMLRSLELPFTTLDGSDQGLREKRNELFEMSGVRGNYPQLFVVDGSDPTQISFIGTFDTITDMNDSGQLASLLSR